MNILQHSAEKTGKVMTEVEINSFLEEKLNLHLATVDEKGEPNIQPVGQVSIQVRQRQGCSIDI